MSTYVGAARQKAGANVRFRSGAEILKAAAVKRTLFKLTGITLKLIMANQGYRKVLVLWHKLF
jgi:hypothetical protein